MSTDSKFGLGLVIGKFLPPHMGHLFLIRAACQQSERVTVIVCDRPDDPISGVLRAAWIRELEPSVEVLVIDDRYDADDSELWAGLTFGWLGRAPDAVFTSEDYGSRYACAMGCVHVCVDRARAAVPCSGTAVRADPFACWDFIAPPVRGFFTKRVCVLGAESTGTTTLSMALAAHYRTAWVPEYGREYSEIKQARGESEWQSSEFLHIAAEQNRQENAAARQADRVLICDTDSFATHLWHRRYIGRFHTGIAALAAQRRCDLYLLTGDEIPFVQDGLRDGEHIRHTMHGWFEEALRGQPIPWLLLRGPHEARFSAAVQAINGLFAGSKWRPPELGAGAGES